MNKNININKFTTTYVRNLAKSCFRGSEVKRQGFTIVELLIVIVVIGILATIIIVAYNGI